MTSGALTTNKLNMNAKGIIKKTVVFDKVNKKSKAKAAKNKKSSKNHQIGSNAKGTITSLWNKQASKSSNSSKSFKTNKLNSHKHNYNLVIANNISQSQSHRNNNENDNQSNYKNVNRNFQKPKKKMENTNDSPIMLPVLATNSIGNQLKDDSNGNNNNNNKEMIMGNVDIDDQIRVWDYNYSIAKDINNKIHNNNNNRSDIIDIAVMLKNSVKKRIQNRKNDANFTESERIVQEKIVEINGIRVANGDNRYESDINVLSINDLDIDLTKLVGESEKQHSMINSAYGYNPIAKETNNNTDTLAFIRNLAAKHQQLN